MKRTFLPILWVLSLVLSSGIALAGQDRWLHVHVVDHGSDSDTVSVNLPLQMVRSLLPTIRSDEFQGGKIRLDTGELEGIDLPEVLRALRDAPDAEFVTVRARDGAVRVAKERGFLMVHADGDAGEKVRLRMPMAVLEALVGSGAGNELDLIAALDVLAEYDGGDLVTVESDDASVRVWIDDRESGE